MSLALRFRVAIKHPTCGTLFRTETFSFNGSQSQRIAFESVFDSLSAAANAVGTGMTPHMEIHGFSGTLDEITDTQRCQALASALRDVISFRKMFTGLEALTLKDGTAGVS